MDRREELHEILCNVLGSRNVYFQPPESVRMDYPAIKYSRNDVNAMHADNENYIHQVGYTVIVIDRDPDSQIVEKVCNLPKCGFDRHYTSDNLNHDVFTLYY